MERTEHVGDEEAPQVGRSSSNGKDEVRLTLADYLELHDRANRAINWPALITAVAGGVATVISAVALIWDRFVGSP